MLLSDTKSGTKAVLNTIVEAEDKELPEAFRRKTGVEFSKSPNRARLENHQIGSRAQKRGKIVTFAKGEAFEQVAGILLASLYEDERVIPQYCLMVDAESGFYGVRADYKVADKIFEIKWGGHEENIEETYQKHMSCLGERAKQYEIIVLETNGTTNIPRTLFGKLVERSPLKTELNALTEYLLELTTQNSVSELEALRDYLYSALRETGEGIIIGQNRTEILGKRLAAVLGLPKEDRQSYLLSHTKHPFFSLEAYFEHKGKLYRGMITPSALRDEEPYKYEVSYYFDSSTSSGHLRCLEFKQQLDRDIAVMLELGKLRATGKIAEVKIEDKTDAVFEKPIFCLTDGIRLASREEQGAYHIKELSDLKKHLKFEGDCFDFGLAWISHWGATA